MFSMAKGLKRLREQLKAVLPVVKWSCKGHTSSSLVFLYWLHVAMHMKSHFYFILCYDAFHYPLTAPKGDV